MTWQRVDLVVEGTQAEALAQALEDEGAVSTEISDADAGTPAERAVFGEPGSQSGMWPRARLRALFGVDGEASQALDAALAASGAHSSTAPSRDRLEDPDWAGETQRQLLPIRAGERLGIDAHGHDAPH